MTGLPVALVYRPEHAQAVLRDGHPLKPARARTCVEVLQAAGILDGTRARLVAAGAAADADIVRVHAPAYVDIVRRLSDRASAWRVPEAEAAAFGFSEFGDNPPFAGMYDYYLLICGAAIEAARLVDEGQAPVAFVPAGGVNHHAMARRASGFGVFNDAAVAIAWLRERGRRVMYVDLDVHHGDGVEAMFEDDDRVLTISIHESTRFLFPGPKGGAPDNIGSGRGHGYSANVGLAPLTGDEPWLWAFDQIVPALYGAFRPDVLFVQLGADGYYADPLAHLALTTLAYETAAQRLMALTNGRLVAVGGGGYDVDAAPRIWATEFAVFARTSLPAQYRPDGGEPPALEVRRAADVRRFNEHTVQTVQRLVFPIHGL